MTQDLDALPLPAPTHFRNGVLYAFSADQIRADRIKVWELAMRKAQEGREPVGEVFLSAEDGKPVPKLYGRYANLPDGTKLYIPPPPPKSDEARDALLAARDYVQQALVEHDRMYCRHPATESDRKLIVDDLAQVDAALAAQQKGGAAS